jgi:hypothetical protein
MGISVEKTVYVDVDIDAEDLLDISDADLAKVGLYRAAGPLAREQTCAERWQAIRLAIFDGDQQRLLDLLNEMAWDQAGLMLPVMPRLKAVAA